jgi:hypothetical protein
MKRDAYLVPVVLAPCFPRAGLRHRPAVIDVDNFDRRWRESHRCCWDATARSARIRDARHSIRTRYRLALFRDSARRGGAERRDLRRRGGTGRGDLPPGRRRALGTPQRPPDPGGARCRRSSAAVAPHIVPDAPPHQRSTSLRSTPRSARRCAQSQDPQFKALEALWRGLCWLASTSRPTNNCALHPGRVGGAAHPEAAHGDQSSGPWSLIVGQYSFGPAGKTSTSRPSVHGVAPGRPCSQRPDPGCRCRHRRHPDPRDWTPAAERASAGALCVRSGGAWIGLRCRALLLRLPYSKSSDRSNRSPSRRRSTKHGSSLG